MSRALFELKGYDELVAKIKRLPDKVKKREIIKILRRAARSTVKASRTEAPKSETAHSIKGGKVFQPGNLAKSIKTATLRRSRVPMVIVGPRSSGKYDGFYGRAFVIPGHVTRSGTKVLPDAFQDRALQQTEGKVTTESVRSTEKYIQKQIDRL